MAGTDTIRGIAFQLAQTLSDVVEFVVKGDATAVIVEGAEDVVDYEFLGEGRRRAMVRQAKTRREPGTWGASELARILCTWGDLPGAADADFAFVTDASLNDSGQRLSDLIRSMQVEPDEEAIRKTAPTLSRGGVRLPGLEVLQRTQILTRMGDADRILAYAESRVLDILSRGRIATLDDAVHAVNALYRRLFIHGGNVELSRRTISRAEILVALGIEERWLAGGTTWSKDTAERYRVAVKRADRQTRNFLPLKLQSVAATPSVLRLLRQSPTSGNTNNVPVPLEAMLERPHAVLVGATGQGKTSTLLHLSMIAADRGQLPVLLNAAGHTAGTLSRRIRQAIEFQLGLNLSPGAIDNILLDPELVLFIDGVSEVDDDTRTALRNDLSRMSTQRLLRVIATGRDLTITTAATTTDPSQEPAAYRLTELDDRLRRQLAESAGSNDQIVRLIEDRLKYAVGNPMLFLMALSVSTEGVPETRAAVYDQFVRGMAFRAGQHQDDIRIDVAGCAWVRLIQQGYRTADHYTWLVALAEASERLKEAPHSRDLGVVPTETLSFIQNMGLLVRLDPDSGLAPMHDSMADYLAARAIYRKHAALPSTLGEEFDEMVLFLIDLAGLDDDIAVRLASENPLLAVRVADLSESLGQARPDVIGKILKALVADSTALHPSATAGLHLCLSSSFTGVVLTGDDHVVVDEGAFAALAEDHPAVLLPPNTGSLRLAIQLWTGLISRAFKPAHPVFQPAPPADPADAATLLAAYLRELAAERRRLVITTLPSSLREKVLATLGPAGMTVYIGEPEPGWLGGIELPVQYRPASEIHIEHCGIQAPEESETLASTNLSRMMSVHPTIAAARDIKNALKTLTDNAWIDS